MVDILLVTVVESDLVFTTVIFQLPIWWRCDNQMHRLVGYQHHFSAVAIDDGMVRFIICAILIHFVGFMFAKIQKYWIFKDVFRKSIGTDGKNVVSLQSIKNKGDYILNGKKQNTNH